jgi:6-pyruvoyl-tetrahydropterin synthase
MATLFVDNLTVIDCSILDPQRGLIGASWQVNVELSGELDEQSMVFDFAKVKKTIKRIIDRDVDHKLIVPLGFEGLEIIQKSPLKLQFSSLNAEQFTHISPPSAVCQIHCPEVTDVAICNYLQIRICDELPANVTGLKLELESESAKGHYYCYSHGLKKHDGNCQRIAHGHRSQIQIWLDGQRASQLERELSNQWQDIYLASEEDLVQRKDGRLTFAYKTPQGEFSLSLPAHRVHLMPTDSTVECIAEHILTLLGDPSKALRVRAFEGIGKGAIATRESRS